MIDFFGVNGRQSVLDDSRELLLYTIIVITLKKVFRLVKSRGALLVNQLARVITPNNFKKSHFTLLIWSHFELVRDAGLTSFLFFFSHLTTKNMIEPIVNN